MWSTYLFNFIHLWFFSDRKVNINNKWSELFFSQNKTSYFNIQKIIKKLAIKTQFIIINVVGTNGKSSVVHYLAQGLIKNKFNVGTFVSPHLVYPTERIKVNDIEIDEKTFFQIKKTLPKLNFFETLYLVALIYFNHKKIDIAIIEAGIGGNNDTTKAITGEIGVVTSIGLDHTNILGNTLEKIAKDKSGIINSQMKFYIPKTISSKLSKIFISKSNHYFLVDNNASNFIKQNQILASKILKKEFNIVFSDFDDVLGRVNIKKIDNKIHIFDAGHNFDGIQAVIKFLKDKKIEFQNVVICMKKTKNVFGILNLFKNKNLYYFKLNDFFHDFKNIPKLQFQDLCKLPQNTLFIGSFYFIGYLYEKYNSIH